MWCDYCKGVGWFSPGDKCEKCHGTGEARPSDADRIAAALERLLEKHKGISIESDEQSTTVIIPEWSEEVPWVTKATLVSALEAAATKEQGDG